MQVQTAIFEAVGKVGTTLAVSRKRMQVSRDTAHVFPEVPPSSSCSQWPYEGLVLLVPSLPCDCPCKVSMALGRIPDLPATVVLTLVSLCTWWKFLETL